MLPRKWSSLIWLTFIYVESGKLLLCDVRINIWKAPAWLINQFAAPTTRIKGREERESFSLSSSELLLCWYQTLKIFDEAREGRQKNFNSSVATLWLNAPPSPQRSLFHEINVRARYALPHLKAIMELFPSSLLPVKSSTLALIALNLERSGQRDFSKVASSCVACSTSNREKSS